jgi:hypothetical protein
MLRTPEIYTALWNLCATPAFLAKTADGQNHPKVRVALKYRAFDLEDAYRDAAPDVSRQLTMPPSRELRPEPLE